MIGLLATGSSGLGWFAVIGRSRVPSPPAMTTAFNGLRLLSRFPPLGVPAVGEFTGPLPLSRSSARGLTPAAHGQGRRFTDPRRHGADSHSHRPGSAPG